MTTFLTPPNFIWSDLINRSDLLTKLNQLSNDMQFFYDEIGPGLPLGTMASQNADAVAITGGSLTTVTIGAAQIEGSPIGLITPADAKFSDLTVLLNSDPVIIEADGINTRIEMRNWNPAAGAQNAFLGARAGGTKASPAVTPNGAALFALNAVGHDGTDFFPIGVGRISMFATEEYSAVKGGCEIEFMTTPNGSHTRVQALVIRNDKTLNVLGPFDHDGTTFGVFGVTPIVRQTGGAATADLTYSSNERDMLNTLWDMARNYGFLT